MLSGLSEQSAVALLPQFSSRLARAYLDLAAVSAEHPVAVTGAAALLEALREAGANLGLVTGNAEPIGWDKMDRVGLRPYLSFGGFGSLVLDRADILTQLLTAAQESGRLPSGVVYVGDTPADVSAAARAGVPVVATATGAHSATALAATNPAAVLDSYADTTRVRDLLLHVAATWGQ
jgi:phosphoglycolate phosphatase-like HAD superfamily hydrolase